ncbi:MAG: phosphoglycerate mutase family protein [Lentisphaeria bacterium]|nr:phosphoglycerate mutase family protein [Lentisphaeria bacterium]
MMIAEKEIVSFREIPALAAASRRSVLLIRHSYRESLQNGNFDPALTAEGRAYAVACGEALKGLNNVSYGASGRKRTIETVQCLIEGAQLDPAGSIAVCPQLHDTAMFSPPEGLMDSLTDGTITKLLVDYYSTGNAPGMIPLETFANDLAGFLTGPGFQTRNVLFATHDIILVSLMTWFKVYPFVLDDWCGYLQGAFLTQNDNGDWTIRYAVPDLEKREPYQLFV